MKFLLSRGVKSTALGSIHIEEVCGREKSIKSKGVKCEQGRIKIVSGYSQVQV